MNIDLLDLYLKQLIKDNKILNSDYLYLIGKKEELGLSEDFIRQFLEMNGTIIENENSIAEGTTDIFAEINKELRINLDFLFLNKNFSDIIRIFEERCYETMDTYIIDVYLHALQFAPPKTKLNAPTYFYNKFPNDKKIIKRCAELARVQKRYNDSIDYYLKLSQLGLNVQVEIDELLYIFLYFEEWATFSQYANTQNYKHLLNNKFNQLVNDKLNEQYIGLYEATNNQFADIKLSIAYINALIDNGENNKAYETGLQLIKIYSEDKQLICLMGNLCKALKKYQDAIFYFQKAITLGYDLNKELTEVKEIIYKEEQNNIRIRVEKIKEEENLRKKQEAERQKELQEKEIEEKRNREREEEDKLRTREENLRKKQEVERQKELQEKEIEEKRNREREEEDKQREQDRIDREKERELNRRDEERKARQKEEEDRELKETVDEYQQEIDKLRDENRQKLESAENELAEVESGNYGSGDIHTFSSAITRGGDIVNPDKIIIEADKITWKKRSKYLIGGESKTIPTDKISSVDLKVGIIGTDIIIRSFGSGSIHAENFTKSDAEKIKSLLGF